MAHTILNFLLNKLWGRRYTIVDMQPGNETKVEQYGPSCYKIYIKNCEVLEGTEKYVVEVLKDSNLLNLTKS